jgi:hypothetical protein
VKKKNKILSLSHSSMHSACNAYYNPSSIIWL